MGSCFSLSEQDASKLNAILSRENEILSLLSKQQTQTQAKLQSPTGPTTSLVDHGGEILARLDSLAGKNNSVELQQLREEVNLLKHIVEEGFQSIKADLSSKISNNLDSPTSSSSRKEDVNTMDSTKQPVDEPVNRPSEAVFFERNYVVGTIGEQNEEQAQIRIQRPASKPDKTAEGRPSENIFFDKAYAKDEVDDEKDGGKVKFRKSEGSVRAAELRRASIGAIKSPLQSRASVVVQGGKDKSGGNATSAPIPPSPSEEVVSSAP